MEKHHAGSVRAGNDLDLLVALGSDLPGAVRVVPSERTVARVDDPSPLKPKARFSLAGVQMKLSVIKNRGKGGALTLPLGQEQGSYIAKFPSTSFPGVSENEYVNLALAEAIDMEVPERELVEQAEFEGIPEEFETLSNGKNPARQTFRSRRWRRTNSYRGFRSGVWYLSLTQIPGRSLSRYRCCSRHGAVTLISV